MKITIECKCGDKIEFEHFGEMPDDLFNTDTLTVTASKYEFIAWCIKCGDYIKLV